jgi:hypothetical protein
MPTAQPTEKSENEQALSAVHEKPLKESLADASVLLWYATREGKQVTEKTISDIVLAQSSLSAGIRDPEVEGRFWAALRDLAGAVKPACVDSILATYSYPFGDYHSQSGKHRLVDATTAKKRYTWAAVGVLIGLLVVQMYWFVGATVRANLDANRAELDGIAGALRVRSAEINVLQSSNESAKTASEAVATTASLLNFPDLDPALANFITSRDPINKITDLALLDMENKTNRSTRVMVMLANETAMLQGWDIVTKLEHIVMALTEKQMHSNSYDQSTTDNEPIFQPFSTEKTTNDYASLQNRYKTAKKVIDTTLQSPKVEQTLSKSKWILALLSQYVLPLLYGLMGSLAYILRSLSTEIQNVTFTRGSDIRYSLRWPLGMLGGVTVGLFFDPTHLSGFAAITPLGLAFLAGYGVELLFTGLDGMVGAFTGGNPARSKGA